MNELRSFPDNLPKFSSGTVGSLPSLLNILKKPLYYIDQIPVAGLGSRFFLDRMSHRFSHEPSFYYIDECENGNLKEIAVAGPHAFYISNRASERSSSCFASHPS